MLGGEITTPELLPVQLTNLSSKQQASTLLGKPAVPPKYIEMDKPAVQPRYIQLARTQSNVTHLIGATANLLAVLMAQVEIAALHKQVSSKRASTLLGKPAVPPKHIELDKPAVQPWHIQLARTRPNVTHLTGCHC